MTGTWQENRKDPAMEKRHPSQPCVTASSGLDQGKRVCWRGDPDSTIGVLDDLVQKHGAQAQPWGQEASIDLFGCDPAAIRDGERIRAFAIALCDCMHLRRSLDPVLLHCGADERGSGFSLVQLIETSAISAHFIEQVNAVCLTIFSCTAFRPFEAARFSQEWFGAREVQTAVAFRGPTQRNSRGAAQDDGPGPGSRGETGCAPRS